ncbi:MAG: hypothetical protein AAGN35_20410 [Bacteroidota bacterium]
METKPEIRTIGPTKSFRIVSLLTGKARRRFQQYLDSYLYTGRSTVPMVLKTLMGLREQPDTPLEEFFARAFPESVFSRTRCLEALSHFMEAFKAHVAIDQAISEVNSDRERLRLGWLEGLDQVAGPMPLHREPLLWQEYQTQYAKLNRRLRENRRLDLFARAETHFCEAFASSQPRSEDRAGYDSMTDRKIDAADWRHYITRLRESCIMITNHRARSDRAFSQHYIQQTLALRKVYETGRAAAFLQDLQVQFYERVLHLLYAGMQPGGAGANDPDAVRELCALAARDKHLFDEDGYGFGLLSNIIARQINRGREEFSGTYFDLFHHLFARGRILTPNGRVPAIAVRNLVITGYRLGTARHIERVDTLLRRVRTKLDLTKGDRTNFLQLCAGWKLFFCDRFKGAFQRISGLQFSDQLFQLQVYDLIFKCALGAEAEPGKADPEVPELEASMANLRMWLQKMEGKHYQSAARTRQVIGFYERLVALLEGKVAVSQRSDYRAAFRRDLAAAPVPNWEKKWLNGVLEAV